MPAKEIRKVAFVTTLDSTDVNNWSGIMLYLHDALASVFPEVVRIGPLRSTREPVGVVKRLASWTKKMDHPLWLTKASAKGMARQVEEQLAEIKPDAVFCIWHPPLAFLRTNLPTFMFQDSPFEIIQPLYDGMSNLTPAIMEEVQLVERMAAKRCSGIIETSEWAAGEARKLWRLPEEKVAAIPFGANVETTVTLDNLESVIEGRGHEECRLLWLGKDWERKGGDIALGTAKLLHDSGIKTKLQVVGCLVPGSIKAPYLEEVGFIDKRTVEGKAKLQNLLASAHFLILPTRAEAFGIVYLEAAAYAMPSLAPDVMGVGSAVLHGKTGILLESQATAPRYVEEIKMLWYDQEAYVTLAKKSFETYQEQFTWKQVAMKIKAFMQERAG